MLTTHRKSVLTAAFTTGALAAGLGIAPAEAAPAHPATTPHYREYVALGDSYSADVFTSLPFATDDVPLGCAQSPSDYPHQVAAALDVATFRDATCGSAQTTDMTKPQSLPVGPANPAQFDRLTKTTDLVTIGIGGNDIGLVGIVESCLSLTPIAIPGLGCKATNTKGGTDQVSAKIAATASRLRSTIAGIKTRSPHARIVVVNYLDAVPVNGTACWGPVAPVTKVDMTWFAEKFREMNTMIANVAKGSHVELADTFTPTIGHDVCKAPGVRYVEGLVPLSTSNKLLLALPFHPNQAGANAQTQAVVKTIEP